jgi:hypothetical protein
VGAVDRLRAARRHALNAADERRRFVALDDEVHVVALHRKVNDAKGLLVRRRE